MALLVLTVIPAFAPGVPVFLPVFPAFYPVIPAFYPVIPAKAGIQKARHTKSSMNSSQRIPSPFMGEG